MAASDVRLASKEVGTTAEAPTDPLADAPAEGAATEPAASLRRANSTPLRVEPSVKEL